MDWKDFVEARGLPHEGFEYVDGSAVEMPMVKPTHTELRDWLLTCGNVHAGFGDYGRCSGEPGGILVPGGNLRLPDVFFWSKEQNRSFRDRALDGPADLVIEILSPSTKRIDYGPKFDDYEVAGCREYWLMDPDRPVANDYFVLRDGHFRPHLPEVGDDGVEIIRSTAVPGLWFRTDWFATRPPVSEVMAAWGLGK